MSGRWIRLGMTEIIDDEISPFNDAQMINGTFEGDTISQKGKKILEKRKNQRNKTETTSFGEYFDAQRDRSRIALAIVFCLVTLGIIFFMLGMQ